MIAEHSSEPPVLFVDDEPQFLRSMSLTLRSAGIKRVLTLEDSREVMSLLGTQKIGVVVLDLAMPYLSGQALLEKIALDYPDIPIIIITATNDLKIAVDCMRQGAFDYIVKPVDKNRLITTVTRALETSSLKDEVYFLKECILQETLCRKDVFADILTQNRAMHAIFRYVEAVSLSQQPVLITGETGTGKELIAKAIHTLSRPDGEYVAVNVAGLDDNVFSDTLFGHKKGAYTGAERSREGLIATAAGGTLFLDEIGDLGESSQVKLLRLLQDGKYYPLGSDQPRSSNARVIVATNCDILQLARQGKFRKDLFYRLRGHHIHIPPLRERKDDLPLLVNYFLEKSAQALQKPTPTPPVALYSLLKNYSFPGNVRELEAMIHDAVTRHQGGMLSLKSFKEVMDFEQIPSEFGSEYDTGIESAAEALSELFRDRLPTLKEAENCLIEEAMRRADGNQGIAAGMLGLTRQALNKRLVRDRRESTDVLSN